MKQLKGNPKETKHELETFTKHALYSYGTLVAFRIKGCDAIYRTDTKHSRTTERHIKQWILDQTADEGETIELSQERLERLYG
jgi:hypothetical protein